MNVNQFSAGRQVIASTGRRHSNRMMGNGVVNFRIIWHNLFFDRDVACFPMETPAQKIKILFLCTWNASRSIFAEYFMKDIGACRFEAFSAGVTPKGQVSPITVKVLQDKFRIDASGARSKSWEEFKDEYLDFIVSVSERAEQTSHAFPGKPILAHWPYDDPTNVKGSPEKVEIAYVRVATRILYRLRLFNCFSFEKLDRLRIELKMKKLAELNREI
jgi:arsenate reductase